MLGPARGPWSDVMTVLAFGASGFPGGCLGDLRATCRNSVVSETPSPGAELKAVVFTRDCGATTGSRTHVSVLPYRAALSPRDEGSVFIMESDDVHVDWVGRNRLRLWADPRAHVFKAEKLVAGVRIEYPAPTGDGD